MLASEDLSSQRTQDGVYDVDFLRRKIVDIINTMTQELNKPSKARYSSIRLAGDSIIDHFKTDFSGTELINVTFRNTILSNSKFSPGLFEDFPGGNDTKSFLKTALEAVLSRGSTIFQLQTNVQNSNIVGDIIASSQR
jgi:uncharacterized protein YjbI with pentapeptide repeats